MFTAVLFTIAKIWKSKRLLTDEWTEDGIYVYTHVYTQWNATQPKKE